MYIVYIVFDEFIVLFSTIYFLICDTMMTNVVSSLLPSTKTFKFIKYPTKCVFKERPLEQRSIRLKCYVRKDQYVKYAIRNINIKSSCHPFDLHLCSKPNSIVPISIEEVFDVDKEIFCEHEKNKNIT